MKRLRAGLLFFCLGWCLTCIQAQVHLISSERIEVNASCDKNVNPSMAKVLNGYRKRLGSDLTKQIGFSAKTLLVNDKNHKLSYLLADLLFAKASRLTPQGVDLAIINLGGIRAPLRHGPVRVADLYKIMPFENELVVLELKGRDLWSVLNVVAKKGGGGLSNVHLTLQNKKLHKVCIGGVELEKEKVYKVATMDYLAEGNSGMSALRLALKRSNTGYKVRNIFIDEIEQLTAQGKMIHPPTDKRVKQENK